MGARRAVFIALGLVALFAAGDAVRCLLPARPIDIDAWRPSFFFQYVRAEGLADLEQAASYERVHFYTHGSSLKPQPGDLITAKEPWLLIPLNRPDRANGVLVVAEVSLASDELPRDFDPNEIEFLGLIGPIPPDILAVVAHDLPRAEVVTRLQVGVRPSILISLALLAWSVLTIRIHSRNDNGKAGVMSLIVIILGAIYLVCFLFLRLRASPDANAWGPCIFGMLMATFGHIAYIGASSSRGPSTLRDDQFTAALALQDKLRHRP